VQPAKSVSSTVSSQKIDLREPEFW